MVWEITGTSPISRMYRNKKEFIEQAIEPLNKRLKKKIVPTVRKLYAEGDTVIALWDGKAEATDNKPYNNTYSWYIDIRDQKIVHVVACFDSINLAEIWERISI